MFVWCRLISNVPLSTEFKIFYNLFQPIVTRLEIVLKFDARENKLFESIE